jgi:hypothetical protein
MLYPQLKQLQLMTTSPDRVRPYDPHPPTTVVAVDVGGAPHAVGRCFGSDRNVAMRWVRSEETPHPFSERPGP